MFGEALSEEPRMLDLSSSHPPASAEPMPGAESDYAYVKRAIEYVSRRWRTQPSLEEIAAHVGLSAGPFHRLFRRWAGLTPKEFLQAITLDHARAMLRDSASLLDTAYEVGLSGPGRLHDLFLSHEAMSPGDFKSGGAGLALRYGFHPSPFGEAILVAAPRGLAGLGFVDDGDRATALADMRRRWPSASFVEDPRVTAAFGERVFDSASWRPETPLRVILIGTDFEIRVWETLLRIPIGRATTYSAIAGHLDKPKAARAVGAAVGRNPLSFVVPCHRVIGGTGALAGYHWGLTRKRAILGWEAGKREGALRRR